jgi:hypothetical protein
MEEGVKALLERPAVKPKARNALSVSWLFGLNRRATWSA